MHPIPQLFAFPAWAMQSQPRNSGRGKIRSKISALSVSMVNPIRVQNRKRRMSIQAILRKTADKFFLRRFIHDVPTLYKDPPSIHHFRVRLLSEPDSVRAIQNPKRRPLIRAAPEMRRIHGPTAHSDSTFVYNTLHFAQIGRHCRSGIRLAAASPYAIR